MALLRDAGLDLQAKLKPAYPAEDFFRWIKLAAAHLHPTLSERDAAKKIAEAAVHKGLQATLLGRALLAMMKAIGVRRALLQIGRSFKHGNNYVDATVTEKGPTAMEIRFNTVMDTPGYFEGILESGARLLHARNVRVTELAAEGEALSFRIEWTD